MTKHANLAPRLILDFENLDEMRRWWLEYGDQFKNADTATIYRTDALDRREPANFIVAAEGDRPDHLDIFKKAGLVKEQCPTCKQELTGVSLQVSEVSEADVARVLGGDESA